MCHWGSPPLDDSTPAKVCIKSLKGSTLKSAGKFAVSTMTAAPTMTMNRSLRLCSLLCALLTVPALFGACVTGVSAPAEETPEQGAPPPGGNTDMPGTPDPQMCGGECGAFQYTLCTCSSDDPCGWSDNGFCDLDACAGLITTPFADDKDCADSDLKDPNNQVDPNPDPNPDPDPDPGPDPNPDPGPSDCTMTMCLTGAIDQNTPSNFAFAQICERNEIQGLIPDCDDPPCLSTFNNFLVDNDDIYEALFDALDTNGDRQINASDQRCELNLLGYSWGGVNVIELANDFVSDSRVSGDRAFVDRIILLEAYQPFGDMDLPSQVGKVRSYRRSSPPANDCSAQEVLGPYVGLAPRCPSGVDCMDYDYSLGGSTSYPLFGGGSQTGSQVDHCSVPAVAHEAVISELLDRAPNVPLPPTVPVGRP